jgi:hypothetical protein
MNRGMVIIFSLVLSLVGSETWAQRSLEITKRGLLKSHYYTIQEGEILSLKIKGDHQYQRHKITFLSDSLLILENGVEIRYTDLKRIKIDLDRHLLGTFRQFFFRMGIGFFPLNTLNNLITENRPIVQESALLISGACLTVSAILRGFAYKRIKINNHLGFRLIEKDFQKLGK